jgi:tape measure domain-containing protein
VAGSLGEAQLQLTVDDKAFQAGLSRARKGVEQIGGSAQVVSNQVGAMGTALKGLVAGIATAALVRSIAQIGQESQRTKIQLEAIASAYGEVETAGKAVNRIQRILGISAVEARQGYSQLYAALRGTGISAEQLEVLYVGLNKAARLSGAGSQEAAGALLQLKQGLASGVLAGDELRSVLESMPALTQQLAREMGVTVGELKKLGSEGKITSEVLYRAAAALADSQAPAKTSVETLAAAWTNLREKIAEAIGPALVDAFGKVTVAVQVFAKYMEQLREPIGNVFKTILGMVQAIGPFVAGIYAVRKAMQLWALASKAVAAAQAFITAMTGPQGIALVAAAAGAATLAYAGLGKVMGDIGKEMAGINEEAAKASKEFKQLLNSTGAVAPNQSKMLADYEEEKRKSGAAAAGELESARRLAGLEGEALQIARSRLEVDQARAKYLDLQARANAAPNDGKLRAQVEAAGEALKTAQIQAGEGMKQAAKDAAEQLKQAGDQLKNTLRSNLDLLNAGIRQKVIDDARKSLNTSLATGRYDNQAVLSQVKTNQDLLDMASKLESINADFDNYSKAQDNVARVQEQMGVSFAELGIKLDTTAAEIAALAKKDWTVYVNGSSVSSYGEMVSAMNRGMQ